MRISSIPLTFPLPTATAFITQTPIIFRMVALQKVNLLHFNYPTYTAAKFFKHKLKYIKLDFLWEKS